MPSVAKELMMQEIAGEFENYPYAFISSFNKMNVEDLSDLRRKLEGLSKRSMVMKHTLVRKVFEQKDYAQAANCLESSVLVTFGDKDPQAISKALVDYAKTNDKVAPRGVIFEGEVYEAEFVNRLAKLPSRIELLTQVVVRVQSPISGLVTTLGQVVRGLVTALDAVRQKKESGSQAA